MRQDVGTVSPPNWLDRYRAGQRDRVWHELRQLGGAVREPGLMEEAQLVCDEMAWRARQNVEVIIERLSSVGYRFHANDDAQDPVLPHVPPAAGAVAHADWLTERFGPRAPDPAVVAASGRGRLAGRHAPAVGRVGIG